MMLWSNSKGGKVAKGTFPDKDGNAAADGLPSAP
jgi:hypothetical protein